jgi:hypothetical protein
MQNHLQLQLWASWSPPTLRQSLRSWSHSLRAQGCLCWVPMRWWSSAQSTSCTRKCGKTGQFRRSRFGSDFNSRLKVMRSGPREQVNGETQLSKFSLQLLG